MRKGSSQFSPITDVGARRVRDTRLIDRIRAILSNSQYVYDTEKHSGEVFTAMKEIKDLIEIHSSNICTICTSDGNTALHIACGTVTSLPDHINPAVLANKNSYNRNFRVRNDIVISLLNVGANPFLLNNHNQTSVEVAPEGAHRESLITLFLEYRSSTERAILSVPPLDTSRLMKRTLNDNGHAIFSNICKNCVYYLYKGAIYLWDIKNDVEHVIYQPRDEDPKINALENQYATFERKKSITVQGAARGSGKWTSRRQNTVPPVTKVEEGFDPYEGSRILDNISLLEARVPMVRYFVLVTGVVDTSVVMDEKSDGVYEWVICNTGTAIGVRLGTDGIRLRQCISSLPNCRKQSHVCGEVAQYPKHYTIDTNTLSGCPIRFNSRPNVTCVIGGLKRKFAYIVPKKSELSISAPGSRRSSTNESINILNTTQGSGSVSLNSVIQRSRCAVSFKISESPEDGSHNHIDTHHVNHRSSEVGNESMTSIHSSNIFNEYWEDKVPASDILDKIFTPDDQQEVFRVGRIKPLNKPNESISDSIYDLCTNSNPFERSLYYTEYKIPTLFGDAIFVGQCGEDLFVMCCVGGVIVADVTEEVNKPMAIFYDISKHIRPQGPIRGGVTSGCKHLRKNKSELEKCHFVVLSEIVEIFMLVRDSKGSIIVTPLFRNMNDSVVPHIFYSFFHGDDDIVIAYQSLKRTELCVFNTNTYTIESLCKLPRPSSLRFFPPKAPGSSPEADTTVADLPNFVFALSTDRNYLLRYNTTMHVMSVYCWDEVIQRSKAKRIPVVTSVFCRKPKMADQYINLAPLQSSLVGRNIYCGTTTETDKKMEKIPYTWLVLECDLLQRLTKKHNLLKRDSAKSKNSLCSNINTVISDSFQKIITGHGGKQRQYVPPVFTYSHSEDDIRTQEEITEMAETYYESRPMYEGVWCSTFNETQDALRCAIALLRELHQSTRWSKEVLALSSPEHNGDYKTVKTNYSSVERGAPEVRCLIFEGDNTSVITDFIVTHGLSTDVSNNVMDRPCSVFKTRPIKKNGVIILPTKILKRIRPLLALTDNLEPVSVELPIPKKSVCCCGSPPAMSPGDTNNVVGNTFLELELSLVVPREFKGRIENL